jgi:molybdate transport system substrate-binding protein
LIEACLGAVARRLKVLTRNSKMENGSLVVMSTLAVRGPLDRLIGPEFERQTGERLSMTYDPTTVLMAAIASGQRGDVIVAIEDAVDLLARDHIVKPDSRVRIARTAIGLAKKAGSAPVDISSPSAFVETLRSARSIVFSNSGASGIFFRALIEKLGIAEEIRKKAIVIPKGFTAELLVSGEADLAVQQISELMTVPGVEIVGRFPDPYCTYTSLALATFAETARPDKARRFTEFLTSDLAFDAFAGAGLDPLPRSP